MWMARENLPIQTRKKHINSPPLLCISSSRICLYCQTLPRQLLQLMQNDLIYSIIKDLTKTDIKYVVCGGIACVIHGVERATYDLDIYADLYEENLKKIIEISKKYDLMPRIPEPIENLINEEKRKEWIEKKGALVFTLVSKTSPLQIDLFLKYPIKFSELYKNSEKVKIDDFEFLISSPEDLLKAKNEIEEKRDKDLLDIKELKKIIETRRKK